MLINLPTTQDQLRKIEANKKFLGNPDFEYLLKNGECPKGKKCNFDGIDLENIILSPGANFRNVSLRNADLRGLVAAGVDFTGAKFDNSLMNGCSLSGVICNDTSFKGTKLFSSYAPNSQFRNADFTDANLHHMRFYDEQTIPVNIIPSNLQGATFSNTNIQFAQFANANMANAKGIGVSISEHSTATLVYPTALYQDPNNQTSTAVFCATLMPRYGTKKNVVVSLKDSYAGGSWCNCSSFPSYNFAVVTGQRAKTIKSTGFSMSGVEPQHVTNMGCTGA
ncbi:MAG TPA: pentapeptide repeat-containing protein [Candidatus Babeliales bacterium]|nr:pentapeptide repeat-containing protein [Candidatus Babeliales bacterium]